MRGPARHAGCSAIERVHDKILLAFFGARSQADGALHRLMEMGVVQDDISFMPKNVNRRDDLALKTGSKALDGAALGGLAGGLLGAAAAALVAGASLVIPGLDLVMAGPWVASLAGAGAGGFVGTLAGTLVGWQLPAYEAKYLEDAVGLGGGLIAVRCPGERSQLVERVLEASGGRSIHRVRARSWL